MAFQRNKDRLLKTELNSVRTPKAENSVDFCLLIQSDHKSRTNLSRTISKWHSNRQERTSKDIHRAKEVTSKLSNRRSVSTGSQRKSQPSTWCLKKNEIISSIDLIVRNNSFKKKLSGNDAGEISRIVEPIFQELSSASPSQSVLSTFKGDHSDRKSDPDLFRNKTNRGRFQLKDRGKVINNLHLNRRPTETGVDLKRCKSRKLKPHDNLPTKRSTVRFKRFQSLIPVRTGFKNNRIGKFENGLRSVNAPDSSKTLNKRPKKVLKNVSLNIQGTFANKKRRDLRFNSVEETYDKFSFISRQRNSLYESISPLFSNKQHILTSYEGVSNDNWPGTPDHHVQPEKVSGNGLVDGEVSTRNHLDIDEAIDSIDRLSFTKRNTKPTIESVKSYYEIDCGSKHSVLVTIIEKDTSENPIASTSDVRYPKRRSIKDVASPSSETNGSQNKTRYFKKFFGGLKKKRDTVDNSIDCESSSTNQLNLVSPTEESVCKNREDTIPISKLCVSRDKVSNEVTIDRFKLKKPDLNCNDSATGLENFVNIAPNKSNINLNSFVVQRTDKPKKNVEPSKDCGTNTEHCKSSTQSVATSASCHKCTSGKESRTTSPINVSSRGTTTEIYKETADLKELNAGCTDNKESNVKTIGISAKESSCNILCKTKTPSKHLEVNKEKAHCCSSNPRKFTRNKSTIRINDKSTQYLVNDYLKRVDKCTQYDILDFKVPCRIPACTAHRQYDLKPKRSKHKDKKRAINASTQYDLRDIYNKRVNRQDFFKSVKNSKRCTGEKSKRFPVEYEGKGTGETYLGSSRDTLDQQSASSDSSDISFHYRRRNRSKYSCKRDDGSSPSLNNKCNCRERSFNRIRSKVSSDNLCRYRESSPQRAEQRIDRLNGKKSPDRIHVDREETYRIRNRIANTKGVTNVTKGAVKYIKLDSQGDGFVIYKGLPEGKNLGKPQWTFHEESWSCSQIDSNLGKISASDSEKFDFVPIPIQRTKNSVILLSAVSNIN